MVKNLALAAIVGLFAASAVVAAPEGKKEESATPAASAVAGADAGKDAKDGKEATAENKDEKTTEAKK